jgi:MFS family permease
MFVCLVGCLFGGDTGSIGSITVSCYLRGGVSRRDEFSYPDSPVSQQMPQFIDHFGEMSEFLRGFVVAVILIPSAITGILAGSVSDRISRKKTIALGSYVFALGMAMCELGVFARRSKDGVLTLLHFAAAGAPNLAVLVVGRCIAGSGEGFFLSAATVYLYVPHSSPSIKRAP